MRYEKPTSRDLSELAFATGACASGTAVGQLLPCVDGAVAAIGACTTGTTVAPGGTCAPGQGATDCAPTGGAAA
jgi:hypothetical protein